MVNNSPNQAIGLNLDTTSSQVKPGMMTFALNNLVESFDGNEIIYQNEQSTIKCTDLPQGHRVIGIFNISQINRVVFFLKNLNSSEDQIGYIDNESCQYQTLLSGSCLNFSIDSPIHQLVVKSTNCSTQIFWTDARNSMRYIDFDDLPWIEEPDPNNDFKKIKLIGQLDCNKVLVQPNFSIPFAETEEVVEGGNIITGSYQFVVQYANEIGESYTSFYNVTNPISIDEKDRATQDFNIPTNKAIRLKVKDLDTSGVFDYFNLVVIETINGISTPKLVGTYPISNEEYDILYTGETSQSIQLSPEELFQKFQYYDIAEGVTQSDDRLIWYGVKEKNKVNYHQITSKIKIYWETYKIPYNETEAYNNPINTEKYRGLMRDEVYPFEIAFILRNGKQTEAFFTVGREASPYEREIITAENLDTIYTKEDTCNISLQKERWQVYNTASILGFSEEYLGHENDSCYKGPYQYGEMAFWESEERYFNNSVILGDLAGQKIKHHKLPDELVSPRFSVDDQGNEYIYPIGIKIDSGSLYQAIRDSDLTQEQKDDIVGFKVIRGDRSAGNMSIKAKGHFTNVGKYAYEGQDYYFANYPYNSLQEDPLYAKTKVTPQSGFDFPKTSKPFETQDQGKDQLIFHSPDTHFGRISNIDTGFVKLEAIDYGTGQGHFVPVAENAQYKFSTANVVKASAALASGVALDFSKSGKPSFNGADFASVYTNILELFEKLIARQNFGYNISSIANFNKSFAIPNEGFKIRGINTGSYLVDGFNTIEEGKVLNNRSRETSVYINTLEKFLYPTQYSSEIPLDQSRFISAYSSISNEVSTEQFFNLLKNDLTVSSMTALFLGIRTAASELIPGSDNATTILSSMISLIINPYLTGNTWSQFTELENKEDLCADVAGTYPGIFIDYTTTNPVLSTPPYIQNPAPQNVEIFDSTGVQLNSTLPNNTPPSYTITNNIPIIYPNQNFTLRSAIDVLELTIDQDGYLDSLNPPNDMAKALLAYFAFGVDTNDICGGKLMSAAFKAIEYGAQAYRTVNNVTSEENLSKYREFNVNAYYGALKAYLPSQWGRIYSYTTVDTGYYQKLIDKDGNQYTSFPTVFGGDTYINKFSFKTKLSVFNKSTVKGPDDADIALNEEGNLGNPMFWISTKPISYYYQIDEDALNTAFDGVGLVNKNALYGSLAQTIGSAIITIGLGITASGIGAVPGLIVTAVGGIIYVVGAIFRNIGTKIEKAVIKLYKDLFQQIIDRLGIKNINLDMATTTGIAYDGIFYQYVYGIPTYFVESQVNVDKRQATNDNEGNFFPRVGTSIPDTWLQEARVPIVYDNIYYYNKSFSKQNKENFYSHLRQDFDPNKLCYSDHPNRAIWSEKANLNETLNNWLIYKPLSRFDFPKSFGGLTALNGVANRQVVARFENKTQIYNALTAINTNSPFTAYLGNSELFTSAPPIDLTETDQGSLGSQHKFFLKTTRGIVFIDSKRGQVILLQGTEPKIISENGLDKWLSENLPFYIQKTFKEIDIDNHYKNIGLHGVYDDFYDRLIITKLDYLPLDNNIQYNGTNFTLNNQIIQLTDTRYFCNKSWTLSYSFKTMAWTSWHSYIPNYYTSYSNYFASGNGGDLWNHNKAYDSYCKFYDQQYPYIIQYPFNYQSDDQILQSIRTYCTVLQYQSEDLYSEPDQNIFYNKALIFNRQQNTGILNLVPKSKNSMKSYISYPKYNSNSKDILVTKLGSIFSFNDIKDITKVQGGSNFVENCDPTKSNLTLNESNLRFGRQSFNSPYLRAKDCQVRLILDDKSQYKILNRFIITESQDSII